jgi:hypothetical protein
MIRAYNLFENKAHADLQFGLIAVLASGSLHCLGWIKCGG